MTTTNLKLTRRGFLKQIPPALLVTLAVFGGAGALSAVQYVRTPQQPIILIATPMPQTRQPTPTVHALQVSSVGGNTLARAVVAYDAPDGAVLGAIEQGRAYAVVATYGTKWLQVDFGGSTHVVWVRAGEMLGSGELADLAPTIAPRVVVVSASTYDAQPTPTTDWYTDIATPEPAFVNALIGSDPNALACGGSPLCGGLTNAQAAEAAARNR